MSQKIVVYILIVLIFGLLAGIGYFLFTYYSTLTATDETVQQTPATATSTKSLTSEERIAILETLRATSSSALSEEERMSTLDGYSGASVESQYTTDAQKREALEQLKNQQ